VQVSITRARISLFAAAVLVLCCFLGGCVETPPVDPVTEPSNPITTEFNLVLVGQVVDVNGNITNHYRKTIDISIRGTRTDNAEGYDELELEFTFSDNYRYMIPQISTVSFSSDSRYIPLDYDVCMGYGYDKVENAPAAVMFALDAEREYLILEWEADEGEYLVASSDPDTTPAEILEHFREYLEKFSYGRHENGN
jgi:hypothetical protein